MMAARTCLHQSRGCSPPPPVGEIDELAGVVLGPSNSTVRSESLALNSSRAPDLHRGVIPAVQTYEVFVKALEQNQVAQNLVGQQTNPEQQDQPLKACFPKKEL